MELNEIASLTADQDRGRWFELHDPVDGTPTGIRLRIAGPDSETQRRARLALADELADLADGDGRVSAEAREKARLNSLARCVLGWEITEDGQPVPFNTRTWCASSRPRHGCRRRLTPSRTTAPRTGGPSDGAGLSRNQDPRR